MTQIVTREEALTLTAEEINETYFVFPQNARNVLTKLHFATEELHDRFVREEEKKKA